MRAGATIAAGIVSAGFVAGAAVLFAMAQKSPHGEYERATERVRETKDASSSWSIEIARVRSDPLADFDNLTAFAPRIEDMQRDLRETARGIEALPDRLEADIHVFLSAVDAKRERVERFKTAYAVVRNSTRYLPIAAGNATRHAHHEEKRDLEREIAVLAEDVKTFLAAPDGVTRDALMERVGVLREKSVSETPALANAIANLLAHTEVLLTTQGEMNDLFQKATSTEIGDLSRRLEADLSGRALKHAGEAANLEAASYAAGASAVLVWALTLALRRRRRQGARAEGTIDLSESPAGGAGEESAPAGAVPAAMGAGAEGSPDGAVWDTERGATADEEMAGEMGVRYKFISKHIAEVTGRTASQAVKRLNIMEETHARARGSIARQRARLDAGDQVDLAEELETAHAITAQVRREVSTIANLTRRLAAGSEVEDPSEQRQRIDLNGCVERVARWFEERDGFTIQRQLGAVPEIVGAATELRVVLKEILENAVEATHPTGKAPKISVNTQVRDGKAQVTVRDNGEGIAPEHRKRIFRAFMSTRNDHAGLGLTLVGMLVKKHEGEIRVSSLAGEGTVIRIALPLGTGAGQ